MKALLIRANHESIRHSLILKLENVVSAAVRVDSHAGSGVQVYKAVLRETGQAVAVKVQRPGVEPIILRDLFIFRSLASFVNGFTMQRLGCNAELILDEFGEKLLEELDYQQEARNIEVSPPRADSFNYHRHFSRITIFYQRSRSLWKSWTTSRRLATSEVSPRPGLLPT